MQNNNTPLIIFFSFFALITGIVGAMGGYKYGYDKASSEAQLALAQKDAEKEKAVAEAAAARKSDKGEKSEKKEKTPFEPSTLTVETLGEIEGLSGLSGEKLEKAVYIFNNVQGACQPCQETGRSLGQCYLDMDKLLDKKICANIPALTQRVIKKASQGASPDDIRAVVDMGTWSPIEPGNSPSTGPQNAPITLLEISDFQCPFCKKAQPIMEELEKKYGDKIRKVFINLPLAMHKMAPPAAKAALAAHLQGKFWPFHHSLFAAPKLDEDELKKIAAEHNLKMDQWEKDRASLPIDQALQADISKVSKLGITSTPTFFVNGYKVKGAQPVDVFSRIIDAELAEK